MTISLVIKTDIVPGRGPQASNTQESIAHLRTWNSQCTLWWWGSNVIPNMQETLMQLFCRHKGKQGCQRDKPVGFMALLSLPLSKLSHLHLPSHFHQLLEASHKIWQGTEKSGHCPGYHINATKGGGSPFVWHPFMQLAQVLHSSHAWMGEERLLPKEIQWQSLHLNG